MRVDERNDGFVDRKPVAFGQRREQRHVGFDLLAIMDRSGAFELVPIYTFGDLPIGGGERLIRSPRTGGARRQRVRCSRSRRTTASRQERGNCCPECSQRPESLTQLVPPYRGASPRPSADTSPQAPPPLCWPREDSACTADAWGRRHARTVLSTGMSWARTLPQCQEIGLPGCHCSGSVSPEGWSDVRL